MKNLNKAMAVLMIELIIFLPLTAFAQDAENETAQQQDTTPPFINVTVPGFVTTNRINIGGVTEPMSTVYLYVNGVKQRKSTPNPQGTFNFLLVDLSPLVEANAVKIESIDPAGNINIKEFSTVVDLTKPVITIETKYRNLTSTQGYFIKGSVSEPVKLGIMLNNASVFSAEDSLAINHTILLAEGDNLLRIIAADKANNTDIVEYKIFLDTTPPVISDMTPATGSFFYETDTTTDIAGKTEPFAKIELFAETIETDLITGNMTRKRDKLSATQADAAGNFKLENIDILGRLTIIPGTLAVSAGAETPSLLPAGQEGALPSPERPPEETPVSLVLVITDRVGLFTEMPLNYRVGTCFAGTADWNVINMVEYQSPSSLSPERLEEGTEIASFILELTYQGPGQTPVIRDIRFDKACEAESMQTDNLYKYSCQILPNNPSIKKPNDAKTLWYIRYDLKKLEGLNDFSEDVWEDLTRQFKFPIKVKIDYTHKLLNPNTGQYEQVQGYQTKCMDIAYHADTSRIDPRDVLPDWLLDDGAEAINSTIEGLNDVIEGIDKVVEYIAIACGVMFAARIIMTIYRRWVSHSEYIEGKVKQAAAAAAGGTAEKPPCPAPGSFDPTKLGLDKKITGPDVLEKTEQTEEVKKQLGALKQDDLLNEETQGYPQSNIYNLKNLCPQTYAAWQSEAKTYQAYRWACDRFLCRSSPAAWTAEATPIQIRERTVQAAACTQETSSQGIILRGFPADKCTFEGVVDKSRCWVYKGAVYTVDASKTKEGDKVTLKAVGGTGTLGAIPSDAPAAIEVTESSGNVLLQRDLGACDELCKKKKGYETAEGKCLNSVQLGSEIKDVQGKTIKTAKVFEDIQSKTKCPEAQPVCYCLKTLDTVKEPPVKDVWDYRYYALKYYYDPYKYYKERDMAACFGQDSWISKDSPYLDIGDAMPAFQCLCIPQIRNRLVLFKNILAGLHNCLMQIKTTGMADTGVCKEMFTQYICKWLYKVISYFTQGCTPWSGGGKDADAGIGESVRGGTAAIFEGIQETTDNLFADYDNSALRDYLGVGEGAIAEKVCLGALTGDWGLDMEGLIDSAYSQPFHSSASAWPAEREYLTWDPDSEQATYEYRVAWMITPGCDIDSYTVSLSCASDYELYNFDNVACGQAKGSAADEDDNSPSGCDCTSDAGSGVASRVNQNAPGPSVVIYRGGALKQSSFESRSVHSVQTGFQRYDNVKITLNINNPDVAEQCIPEGYLIGKRMGVFYAPISDATTYDIVACRFDPTQGYFRCDQGKLLWNLRGRAYFGRIKCENEECGEKTFYVGDEIKLDPFEVFVQGQKQCLYMQLFNGKGHKLLGQGGEGMYIDLEPDKDDPTKTILAQKLNSLSVLGGGRTISSADFGTTAATWQVSPSAGSYAGYLREEKVTEQQRVNVDFRDINNDQKADEYRLEGTEWGQWDANKEVPIGSMYFKFPREPVVQKDSRCPGENTSCQRYAFTINPPTVETTTEPQDWTLHLELRHAPGNRSAGSCTESRKEDLIVYQGSPQEKDIKLKVKPITKEQDQKCTTGGFFKNLRECDCDGDGKLETDKNDCDGSNKFYCKDNKCQPYPACKPSSSINLQNCDCDWDGELGDKDKKDCTNKYCVNNACLTKQEKEKAAQAPAAPPAP